MLWSCLVLSCVLSCLVVSVVLFVLSCLVFSCLVLSCRVVLCCVVLCCVVFLCCLLSYLCLVLLRSSLRSLFIIYLVYFCFSGAIVLILYRKIAHFAFRYSNFYQSGFCVFVIYLNRSCCQFDFLVFFKLSFFVSL